MSFIKKGKKVLVLIDLIDQITNIRATNGPNICILKESSMSPWRAKQVDLVKKQVGQGIPVSCLKGQDIPGKE